MVLFIPTASSFTVFRLSPLYSVLSTIVCVFTCPIGRPSVISLCQVTFGRVTYQPVYQITPESCVIFRLGVTSQICLFESPFSKIDLLYALSLTLWNHIQQYMNILSILQGSMFRSALQCLYQITAETWIPFQIVSLKPHSAVCVKYMHCHSVLAPTRCRDLWQKTFSYNVMSTSTL